LDNYTVLQRGGQASTVDLLELLDGYQTEASESVWGAISGALGEARRLTESDEASEQKLDSIIQKLVLPVAEKLGWDDAPADDAQTLRLRGLAHAVGAGAKSEAVIEAGLRRFRASKKPADLAASTRAVVYSIAARHGTAADFQRLLKLYLDTLNADEREEIASGLTSAKEPTRYRQLIDMLQTDEIRRQDFFHWYVWFLRNRYTREPIWQWVTKEWAWIEKEFGSDKNLSYFARYPGSIFSRPAELAKFKKFFEPKKTLVAMGHDISLAEAEIASRIAWRQRNEAAVKAWLKKYRPKN
jgi:hypothetical protein